MASSTYYFLCALSLYLAVQVYAQENPCPIEGSPMLPHQNCSLYIQCDNGQQVIVQCPDQTYFNPAEGFCDFAENVPECVGGTRPPDGTTPLPTTTTTTPVPPTEEPTTTLEPEPTTTTQAPEPPTTSSAPEPTTEEPVDPTTPSNGCPAEGFKEIPHPERCEKFLYCLNGEIVGEGQCADGLFFDPILEQCNFEDLVDCVNPEPTTTTEATTTTRRPLPTCPPSGIVNLPYPGNCSLYILCVEEVPILSQCANGTLFDLDTLRCVPSDQARCEETKQEVEVPKSQVETKPAQFCPNNVGFTKMPVANDCHSWYECKDRKRLDSSLRTCPFGLYFYFQEQTCVSFIPEHCLEG